MVDAAHAVLNPFSPNVYVQTDNGNTVRCCIRFVVSVVAEKTEGHVMGSEWVTGSPAVPPDEVSRAACALMQEQVYCGGFVDSNNVLLAFLMCAVAKPDVSRIRTARLSESAVCMLRDLDTLFGVRFNMRVFGGCVRVNASESYIDSENYSDFRQGKNGTEKGAQDGSKDAEDTIGEVEVGDT